jgi:hypothetical protein
MGKDSKIFDQYKKELETSDLTEIKKLLANVEFKQFFCMNLVPIESYLGQNLASTVCLPKNCNEFDGIIEKKIRDSAAKLLTQLLKNEKAGKRSQIVPKDPYNVSTKFNELFTMALREALKELEKEISSIEERIEKLKLLEPILLGLKSPEPEGIFGALRLFSENAQYFFSPPLQLFPRETLRYLVKNFYNELQQYLIESLKEKFKDEDPKNFDEIFLNLSQLKEEQYDEIIAYHELMIEKCAEIFSSIPKKRGIDFNEISYKKRKDSDKISSVQEIDFEKILKNIKAKSLKVKDIKRFWNSIQYNILQNHIYFWFGDFYSLESLEYIIKEISSVLHTDQAIVDSLLPQSSLEKTIMELNEQLEPLKEKLALAKFSIKRCEKISQLKDSFFESFKDQSLISDLELDNGGEKKEVIENPLALNVQTVKVLNKSILKRAKECLLAPFVTINKIEKSPLKPTGFLNQPIFYIIERVNDSDKYPRGLKIIFDSDQYTKLKHFSSFFKSHLKQRYDNGLKLKIGQNVRGVFFV